MPPCAVAKKKKSDFFYLNLLECRLLAPRITFQKLMQAPRGRQLKIHENIFNVPANVTCTLAMLPQVPSQTATIKINLKRKLQYKSSALSSNVRPHKVDQGTKWLITSSSLYRDEGIVFDKDWVDKYNIEIAQNKIHNNDGLQSESGDKNAHSNSSSDKLDNNVLSEGEAEILVCVTDTMFTATDFLEDSEWQNILNIAPTQGN